MSVTVILPSDAVSADTQQDTARIKSTRCTFGGLKDRSVPHQSTALAFCFNSFLQRSAPRISRHIKQLTSKKRIASGSLGFRFGMINGGGGRSSSIEDMRDSTSL